MAFSLIYPAIGGFLPGPFTINQENFMVAVTPNPLSVQITGTGQYTVSLWSWNEPASNCFATVDVLVDGVQVVDDVVMIPISNILQFIGTVNGQNYAVGYDHLITAIVTVSGNFHSSTLTDTCELYIIDSSSIPSQLCEVTVNVLGPSNVIGASVTIYTDTGSIAFSGSTNEQNYAIAYLLPGTYDVAISKTGYTSQSQTFTVYQAPVNVVFDLSSPSATYTPPSSSSPNNPPTVNQTYPSSMLNYGTILSGVAMLIIAYLSKSQKFL